METIKAPVNLDQTIEAGTHFQKTAPALKLPETVRFLSKRQIEIIRLMAEGKNAKEGAGELGISTKTFEYHRVQVYRRLRISNPVHLTHFAIYTGIVALMEFSNSRQERKELTIKPRSRLCDFINPFASLKIRPRAA